MSPIYSGYPSRGQREVNATRDRKLCSRCGQPYHRYSPEDLEHEPSEYGCINALRHALEQAEKELADLHRELLRFLDNIFPVTERLREKAE